MADTRTSPLALTVEKIVEILRLRRSRVPKRVVSVGSGGFTSVAELLRSDIGPPPAGADPEKWLASMIGQAARAEKSRGGIPITDPLGPPEFPLSVPAARRQEMIAPTRVDVLGRQSDIPKTDPMAKDTSGIPKTDPMAKSTADVDLGEPQPTEIERPEPSDPPAAEPVESTQPPPLAPADGQGTSESPPPPSRGTAPNMPEFPEPGQPAPMDRPLGGQEAKAPAGPAAAESLAPKVRDHEKAIADIIAALNDLIALETVGDIPDMQGAGESDSPFDAPEGAEDGPGRRFSEKDAWLRRKPVLLSADGGTIKWGKATGNWVKATGDDSYYPANIFATQEADTGSEVAEETAVNVYLPRGGTLEDPNVITGQVLPCWWDEVQERWICLEGYLDGTIGKSVQLWEGDPTGGKLDGGNASEKPGWTFAGNYQSKFPVGYEYNTEYGYDAGYCTGGYRWHGKTENNHESHADHNLEHTHPNECTYPAGTLTVGYPNQIGAAIWENGHEEAHSPHDGPYNNGCDTDNRPPYTAIAILHRIDNSV